jgi:hypothetical protein
MILNNIFSPKRRVNKYPEIPAMYIPSIALKLPYGNPKKYPESMVIVNVGTAIKDH